MANSHPDFPRKKEKMILIAKQLGYKKDVIKQLCSAKTENELTLIMTSARLK